VHYESFKNLTAAIQSIITSVALVGGGGWAYWRFVLNRESAHKVDLDGLHAPRTFTEIAGDTEMSNRNCGHAAELERISPFHCEASQLRWRSIVLG